MYVEREKEQRSRNCVSTCCYKVPSIVITSFHFFIRLEKDEGKESKEKVKRRKKNEEKTGIE